LRGGHHARHAAAALEAGLGSRSRLGLAVCGPGPYAPAEVGRVVGLPVRAVLPSDPAAAAVLSDGVPAGRGLSRRPLLRAARSAAGRPGLGGAAERALADAVAAALFGLGRLQPLLDREDVENILIEGHDKVTLQLAGDRREPAGPIAGSDAELVELLAGWA